MTWSKTYTAVLAAIFTSWLIPLAILLVVLLAPSLGWTHVLGFVTKLLAGTAPIGM